MLQFITVVLVACRGYKQFCSLFHASGFYLGTINPTVEVSHLHNATNSTGVFLEDAKSIIVRCSSCRARFFLQKLNPEPVSYQRDSSLTINSLQIWV